MSDRFHLLVQHLAPKRLINEFSGWVAGSDWGALTQWIIRRFVRRYGVNMAEAAESDLRTFRTFNQFFTRALRPDARPLAEAEWICPVDGAISQFGKIAGDQIFQAKGHQYSTNALLGDAPSLAAQFRDGYFATLYLSPKDYHRIHMPCAGRLVSMTHVPGSLYSVNPATARGVPGLFARNERVVCVFESAHGPFALVLVGASIVGSMSTTWHGLVSPPRSGSLRRWDYRGQSIELAQGAEMGRFLLGSTVVLLFPAGGMHFNEAWAAGRAVRLGEAMACLR